MLAAYALPPQNIVFSQKDQRNVSSQKYDRLTLINGIAYSYSTGMQQPVIKNSFSVYEADSRNFLQSLEMHADYPPPTDAAKAFANAVCKMVYNGFKLQPTRTANSVEGGIAVVYAKTTGLLRKHYQEVFLEFYNDNTAVLSWTENYKLKQVNEVSIEDTQTIFNCLSKIF